MLCCCCDVAGARAITNLERSRNHVDASSLFRPDGDHRTLASTSATYRMRITWQLHPARPSTYPELPTTCAFPACRRTDRTTLRPPTHTTLHGAHFALLGPSIRFAGTVISHQRVRSYDRFQVLLPCGVVPPPSHHSCNTAFDAPWLLYF